MKVNAKTGYPRISQRMVKGKPYFTYRYRGTSKSSYSLGVCRKFAWEDYKRLGGTDYTAEVNPWLMTKPKEELFVPRRVCTKTGVVLTVFDMSA